ncbi:hypothetical protein BASA81_005150 [Batrachochytrium salamandrivorans]|nr:hypothetical protein BASA81_005150 [Batrachochytrium salamandrivorans]
MKPERYLVGVLLLMGVCNVLAMLYVSQLPNSDFVHNVPAPPIPVKYRKLSPFGRACNRIITLATGLERAKRDNFVLQLYRHEWQPIFVKMDMELFNKTFQGRFEFLTEKQTIRDRNDKSWLVSAPEYWCGLRVGLDAIKTGFRPKLEFQQAAKAKVDKIKSKHSKLVSIHLRHYDGLCGNLLPTGCESSSGYEFLPKPFGCNQTLTEEYWDWVNGDWGNHNNEANTAVYLSTDRQVKSIDDSYLLRSEQELRGMGISKVYQPNTDDLRKGKVKNEYAQTSEMFEDMWISVLSDRHVGMPLSSCDKIVAEWRSVDKSHPTANEMHPKQCYGKYFDPTLPITKHKFCHHTQAVGLDSEKLFGDGTEPCAVCETILAMYVALSKCAENGDMDLHLYGKFAELVRNNFDPASAGARGIYIDYFPTSSEAMLFDRRHEYDSGKFRASGVKAQSQLGCAWGQRLNRVMLPNAQVQRGAQTTASLGNLGPCYRDGNVCTGSSKPTTLKMSPPSKIPASEVIKELWRQTTTSVIQADTHSPCSQLVALWRRELGLSPHTMQPEACFQGYFAREGEPGFVSSLQPNGYWSCS